MFLLSPILPKNINPLKIWGSMGLGVVFKLLLCKVARFRVDSTSFEPYFLMYSIISSIIYLYAIVSSFISAQPPYEIKGGYFPKIL